MAAEELGVARRAHHVDRRRHGADARSGRTGGSTGLMRGGMEIRQAAATARAGAARAGRRSNSNRPAAELTHRRWRGAAARGRRRRRHRRADRRATLRAARWIPRRRCKAPPRYTRRRQAVCGPTCRTSAPGRHVYVQDFTLPGMLHGRVDPSAGDRREARVGRRVARCAAFPTCASCASRIFSASSRRTNGRRCARRARSRRRGATGRACRAARRWRLDRAQAPFERDEEIVGNGRRRSGARRRRQETLPATYFWPFQSHASLGPSCAVADVRADGATIWTRVAGHARAARQPRESLRHSAGEACASSISTARAPTARTATTTPRPTRCCCRRPSGSRCACSGCAQDEHGWDPKGPPQLLDLRAGSTPTARIVAWETQMWVPTHGQAGTALLGPDAAGIRAGARAWRRAASRRTAIRPTRPTTCASSRTG